MNTTVVSLGLFEGYGGPVKTIGAFQEALQASLYCFCGKREIAANGRLAVDGAVPISSSGVPILEQFRYTPRLNAAAAESAFADSGIVSTHSFYRYHSIWVNQMSRRYEVPYWFVPHGILDPWVMGKAKKAKQMFWAFGGRRFLEQSSTVIFSTCTERDKAASLFDLPGAEVVPWPVGLVDCAESGTKRCEVRNSLGIPEDSHVLLYFGRLHTMKRPLETIQALGLAGAANTHLIILGNEQDVSAAMCEEVAVKYGVRDRVHNVGAVYGERKYDFLHAADAYISLSHRENFNHTAAESLSAGVPVILSPGNDLNSEIAEVGASFRLKDDSLQCAAETISIFAHTPPQELLQMGHRGRAWIAENLSFGKFQSRLNSLAERYGRS